MNKLKGTMKMYAFQDFGMSLSLIFILISSNLLFGSDEFQKGVFDPGKSSYLAMIPMIASMDWCFTFSSRFLMQAHFNSSRKLFYKSNLISIQLKTVLISLSYTIYIMLESFICKYNNGKYSIMIFGQKSANIGISNLLVLFTIYFSLILFMYSFSLIIFSIEKFQIPLFFSSSICGMIIIKSMLKFAIKNINNYIGTVVVLLGLALISLTLSWQIIKRKSSLGNSWFVKFQISMSSYSK